MTGVFARRAAAIVGVSAAILLAAGEFGPEHAGAAPAKRPVVAAVHGEQTTPGITRLVIEGDGFRSHAKVRLAPFGAPTSVRVVSAREIVATVDALRTELVRVSVQTKGGTSPRTPADRVVVGPLRGITQLRAHATSGSVRLSWRAPRLTGAARIVVQRGTTSLPRTAVQGVRVASLASSARGFTDKHVKVADTYRYAVFVKYPGRGYPATVAHVRVKSSTGTTWWKVLIGAVVTLLLLVALRAWRVGSVKGPLIQASKATKKRKGLVTGKDNRGSTSKTTLLLWTVVLVFFLITMALLAGWDMARYASLVSKIDKMYLVLIGGPFAAAITASAVVRDRVHRDPKSKPAAEGGPKIGDIVRDDNGDTDLVDTQYVLFNVVVAVTVVIQFVKSPFDGPPHIAGFLASLLGVSAATYTANKGVRPTPVVDEHKPTPKKRSPMPGPRPAG